MSGAGGLEVSGGVAGAGAQLEQLDLAAAQLHRSAAGLREVGDRLRRGWSVLQGLDGLLGDPFAVLALEADLVGVLQRLDEAVLASADLGDGVVVCAALYRGVEESQRSAWSGLGALLGGLTGPSARLAGTVLTGAAPLLKSRLERGPAGPAAPGAAPPDGPGGRTAAAQDPACAVPAAAGGPVGPAGPAGPGPGPGPGPVLLAPGAGAARLLPPTADPQLTAAPGAGVPALPRTSAPLDPSAGRGGGGFAQEALRLARQGVQPLVALGAGALMGAGALAAPPVPQLAGAAVRSGAARGTGASTSAVVTTRQVPVEPPTAPPSGVQDALARVVRTGDGCGPAGRLRVERTTHPDGSAVAVVYLPGVQDWASDAPVPASYDAAVRGAAGQPSAYTDAVVGAMETAGVAPGEPVMLVGHSLGGIAAVQVASDPAVRARFDVQAVITAGSPVGWADVPRGVQLLGLEHADDPVPQLDGLDARDVANVTTVTAPTPEGHGYHDGEGYALTGGAVDASRHPSVLAFRAAASAFFAVPGAPVGRTEVTEVLARTAGP
ncbi:hypothetical protein [Quadrisphaera sp. KR29]|uniref:hypothetical protein n=1 Tax=Quadrisphaera sp. KR29 TaxID=3461391 RepID=UPI004044418B